MVARKTSDLDDVRAVLARLVAFDTTSSRSNLDCLHWIVEQAVRFSARVRYTFNADRSKANAIVSFGPERPGGVMLSAHTDTVPVEGQSWSRRPFELTEERGRLYARGTSDMKGFIAACISSFSVWQRQPLAQPIHLALSYDEEYGCRGAHSLIADLLANIPRPDFVWVGEPTGMRIATAHKGVCVFATHFRGQAAHSSMPQIGRSAVADAVRFAAFLLDLGVEATERRTRVAGLDPPYTTFNLGRFNGGTALNIVACDCAMDWEFRPIPEDDDTELKRRVTHFLDTLRDAPAAVHPEVDHREVVVVPPLRPTGQEAALQLLRRLLGNSDATMAVPFGTEAGLFQLAGIPAIVCGPGSIEQAHQPDEWIEAAQLERCRAALATLPQHLATREAAS
jgi:acetylornithine deacetylase